jgi:hypothetical protein
MQAVSMRAEVLHVVQDYEQLWCLAGFAPHFAAGLARPTGTLASDDPYQAVLMEHRRRLDETLRRAQLCGALTDRRSAGEFGDALLGCYLSRRVGRRPLDGWAHAALTTVLD